MSMRPSSSGNNGGGNGFGPNLPAYPAHEKSYGHPHSTHRSSSHRKYSGDHYKRHYHHSHYEFKDSRPRKSTVPPRTLAVEYKEEHDDSRSNDYHYPSSGSGHEGQVSPHHSSPYNRPSYDHQHSPSPGSPLPVLKQCASVPVPTLQHALSILSTAPAVVSPTASSSLYSSTQAPPRPAGLEVVRKEEAMEIDLIPVAVPVPVPIAVPQPELQKAVSRTIATAPSQPTTVERLEALKRAIQEKPAPGKCQFADWLNDSELELQPVRPTFLSSSVSLKLAGQFGKVLHGEHWRLDPRWMKEEIDRLLASDKQRIEAEQKERLEQIRARAVRTEEMKDDLHGQQREAHRVVPIVHHGGKGVEPTMVEVKAQCRKCKEKETERRKAEYEAAKNARMLAEAKLQFLYSELKNKLHDMKLGNSVRSSA